MTRDEFIRNTESCQKAFRRFLTALCCGDSDEADDIAQESLVKAYLSCDGLKEPAKFKAWLYRIGFNTFFSHRRAVRPVTTLDDAPETEAPERSDGAFRYQALYAALDRIPERERTSILLLLYGRLQRARDFGYRGGVGRGCQAASFARAKPSARTFI